MSRYDCLIIGSGLAGMTTAMRLSDAGQKVCLIEGQTHLGGRTSSWNEAGMEIESGFHRFLGFYIAVPDILQTAGIKLDDILCWEDEVEIRIPDGGPFSTFGAAPLHKPLKTIWNLFGHNELLPPGDKLALGKMFAAGAKDYLSKPLELDKITVREYAKSHDVSNKAINLLLVPMTEGIFFVPVDKYSMHNLMGLVLPYAKTLPKLRVGAFTGGMSRVMIEPMADYIRARGGEIISGQPVKRLLMKNGRIAGAESADEQWQSRHVVLAASLHGAQEIIKRTFADFSTFSKPMDLQTMPAVTFQIELKQPSMELDRTTFGPGTIMTSFTEQSRTTFRESAGRLSIILSKPEEYLKMEPSKILEIILSDALRLGLDIKNQVIDYRKVSLPYDFYSLTTGSEALRPAQNTTVPGLTLAGDYTSQPYLATMEGAVVSGNLAADIVLKDWLKEIE